MARILLVEDNEMSRDMLSRRLERNGFEVILAADGRAGVELARKGAPDLILMDMDLPEINGWDAARILKTEPETLNLPIIALTAYAMPADRDRALAAGCDDYDTKPVEIQRLLTKMDALLRPAGCKEKTT